MRRYLIRKGIAAERLASKGFGPDVPFTTLKRGMTVKKKRAARYQNRRVQFKILERSDGPIPRATTDRLVPLLGSAISQMHQQGWLHLDLYTTDQHDEVERLVGLGARRYPWKYHSGADYVVLEDPDRNLFCVVQVPA